jgi:hypothetical protein
LNSNYPDKHFVLDLGFLNSKDLGHALFKFSSSKNSMCGFSFEASSNSFFSYDSDGVLKPQYVSQAMPSPVDLLSDFRYQRSLNNILFNSQRSPGFENKCDVIACNSVNGQFDTISRFSRQVISYTKTGVVNPILISQRPSMVVDFNSYGGFNAVSLTREIFKAKNISNLNFLPFVSFSTKRRSKKVLNDEKGLSLIESKDSYKLNMLKSLKKQYYIYVDNFIRKMCQKGVIFFFITFNLSFLFNYDGVMYLDNNPKKMNYEHYLFLFIKKKLSNVVFLSIVEELHENGYPHYHLIVGIENLLNSIYTLKSNLIDIFLSDKTQLVFTKFDNKVYGNVFRDIEVKECLTFLQISNSYKYVTKGLFNPGVGNFLNIYLNTNFFKYSQNSNIFMCLRNFYSSYGNLFFMSLSLDDWTSEISNFSVLANINIPLIFNKGTISYLNCLSYETFVYIFKLFFKKNGIFLFNKELYYLYNFFGCTRHPDSVKVFDVENYYTFICNWCIEMYPLYFKDFPFDHLKILYLKRFKTEFEREPGFFLDNYTVV